jgi:hypothetical protein
VQISGLNQEMKNISLDMELQHYNERLRELSEVKGFWSIYGSYLILLILKLMQKVT